MKKIYVLTWCHSGPVIRHNGIHKPEFRPDYSAEEARQVVNWMNGKDEPLTNMVPWNEDPHIMKRCGY